MTTQKGNGLGWITKEFLDNLLDPGEAVTAEH